MAIKAFITNNNITPQKVFGNNAFRNNVDITVMITANKGNPISFNTRKYDISGICILDIIILLKSTPQ